MPHRPCRPLRFTSSCELPFNKDRAAMLDAESLRLDRHFNLSFRGVVRNADRHLDLVGLLAPAVRVIHATTRQWRCRPSMRMLQRGLALRVARWWQVLQELCEGVAARAGGIGRRGELVAIAPNELHRLPDDALRILAGLHASRLCLHTLELLGELSLRLDDGVPEPPRDEALREEFPIAAGIRLDFVERGHVPDGALH